MKSFVTGVLLVLLISCLASAITLFGGVVPEHAVLFYLIAALLLVVWAVQLFFTGEYVWAWSPVHIPVLLFAGYTLVRYFQSPLEYESRIDLLNVGFCTAIYFLAAASFRGPHREWILIALAVLGFAESFYAMTQAFGRTDNVLWLERDGDYAGRGGGTYYCPNHLAGFLEMVLGLLAVRLLVFREMRGSMERKLVEMVVTLTAMGFMVLGLRATLSRGGWIAAGAGALVLLLWAEWTRVLSSKTVLKIFTGLFLLAATTLLVPSVRNRIQQSLLARFDVGAALGQIELSGGGVAGREPMWKDTLHMIRDRPWFGTGPGTWTWFHLQYRDPRLQLLPRYVHNDVLQLASDYGLIGFTIALAVMVLFFWQVVRLSRRSEYMDRRVFAGGAAAAIAAMLVHSLVDFNLHIPANALLFATIIGLTVGMGNGSDESWRITLRPVWRIGHGLIVLVVAGALGWTGISTSLAARYIVKGYDASQLYKWPEATNFYERALRYDSKNPEIHVQMGDMYWTRATLLEEDLEGVNLAPFALKAAGEYERALALNPYQSSVLLRLALVLEMSGDKDAALNAYQRALAVDPDNAFVFLRLGIFYQRIGEKEKAITALQHSATLNSNEPTALDLLKELQAQ